ncbi:lipopolysaccharide biosynthesis protein [Fibrella arboris]|uniref:lipopolysaccharide biosynthesis protein n=1 Tax=Fibrella arboris TaxID=3242486 RepID=UPI003521B9F9
MNPRRNLTVWLTDRVTSVRTAHPRSRQAFKNSVASVLVKGGNIVLSFILVRITLGLLHEEKYGIWTAISSLVTFASFFDIGLGNGLRNRLTEAVAQEDHETGRTYISTAYVLFTIIQLALLLVACIAIYLVDWKYVLNVRLTNAYVSLLVLVTLAGFCSKILLDTVSYVLLALQKTALSNTIYLVVNIGLVAGIWGLGIGHYNNLLSVSIMSAIVPVIVLIAFSFYYYRGQLRDYAPSLKAIDFSVRPKLMSLGLKFFIIQLAGVVIFYTDNVLISKLFGPKSVTEYSVVFRYYNAINSFFFVIISPFWSAFTEAYAKNELAWVKTSYSRLKRSWLVILLVIGVMLLVSAKVYHIWLGPAFKTSWSLNILMAIFVLVSCWNNITVTVINGFGKVKMQLFTALAGAVINIPLCVYLGRTLSFGNKGIIIASIISLLLGTVFGTIQADKLVSRTARGIWAE